MAEEIIVRTVQINTDQAVKNLEKVDDAAEEVAESTSEVQKGMTALPGPLGKAQAGVAALGKAFKALLANPVVLVIAAIVAGLTLLFKAFTKTEEGADKMNDAMEAFKAIIDVVVERAAMLFKALGKIFTGKFKEGFGEVKDSVSGLGEEFRAAAKDAIALEQAQRKLFEANTALIEVNAQRRQDIAELILKTRDLTLSVEERRQAIVDAGNIENEMLADSIKLQEQRIANMAQEIANTPELQRTREQSLALAQEEAKLIDLGTKSINKQRSLKNRLITLENEQAAAIKARADIQLKAAEEEAARLEEQREIDNEARREQAEFDMDFDQAMREEEAARDAAAAEERIRIKELETQALITQAELRFGEEEKLIQQQIADEMILAQTKESIYQNSLTALLGFLGEGSKIGKGIQVADATRTAIISAMEAYKAVVGIVPVGPILAPIAAAATLAAAMANVRKIVSSPSPLGGGGVSVPSVSLARPAGGISAANLVNADQGVPTDVSIIQDSTSRKAGKAYVVSSEVTAEQEIDRQKQVDATL